MISKFLKQPALLSLALAIAPTVAFAQTTTEIREVVTQSVSLPATGSYVVVDPLTGVVSGNYDLTSRTVNGTALVAGSVIIDRVSGNVLATVDRSGRLMDISSTPATDALVAVLKTRMNNLSAAIDDAAAKGQISADRAAQLHAELAKSTDRLIANTLAAPTYSEAITIAYNMNVFQNNLRTTLPAVAIVNVAPALSYFTVTDGKIILVNDLDSRRMQISTAIDVNYNRGKLTNQQVLALKDMLHQVSEKESKYRLKGSISPKQDRELSCKLDKANAKMSCFVGKTNDRRAKIGLKVD